MSIASIGQATTTVQSSQSSQTSQDQIKALEKQAGSTE
jgi:hypothetical protein